MSWNFTCPKKKKDFSFETFSSVENLPKEVWSQVLEKKNIYLSLTYLSSIEMSMSDDIEFRYTIYKHKTEAVAISYVQIINFNDVQDLYHDNLVSLGTNIRNKLLSNLNLRTLICGNVYNCGENGFYYIDSIDSKDAYKLLSMSLFKIRNEEEDPISLVLVKEFWPSTTHQSDILKSNHFTDFNIDVNMVLKIHNDWNSYDIYLDSLTTKFRTKSKSVYKKSANLEIKHFTAMDIQNNEQRLKELFDNVLEKATFKFGSLTIFSFKLLKEKLKDKYIFKAYYLKNKLIGFSTAIIDNNFMDANFVGIDYKYNNQVSLYQRMLYDFVHSAIKNGVKELRLGRTAEQIKSCTGASPTHMRLYIRHCSLLHNRLLKPIIESIAPSEFNIRKPFKVDFLLD